MHKFTVRTSSAAQLIVSNLIAGWESTGMEDSDIAGCLQSMIAPVEESMENDHGAWDFRDVNDQHGYSAVSEFSKALESALAEVTHRKFITSRQIK